jgi:predicted patatin/cPLA2 family phospholipase
MIEKFEELIISSGGNRGYALLGAINQFFKYHSIENIKYFTGCSFGALICLLFCIDYTLNDINDILFKLNFGDYQEYKIANLIDKCGLDEGIKFTNILKAIILNKNYDSNITFKELYDKTNKILTIAVVNITKGIPEYHNYITTPNLSILLSVRMSSNIPIIFSPIFYNNNYYVDGALLDPFPYYYNKNTKKIGLWLFEEYEFKFIRNNETNFLNDLTDSFKYVLNLLKIIYINYMKKYYKKIPKNVIYINFELNNIKHYNFNLSMSDKINMFNIGKHKTNDFIKRKYKIYNKKYLLFKYFYLWKFTIKSNKNSILYNNI